MVKRRQSSRDKASATKEFPSGFVDMLNDSLASEQEKAYSTGRNPEEEFAGKGKNEKYKYSSKSKNSKEFNDFNDFNDFNNSNNTNDINDFNGFNDINSEKDVADLNEYVNSGEGVLEEDYLEFTSRPAPESLFKQQDPVIKYDRSAFKVVALAAATFVLVLILLAFNSYEKGLKIRNLESKVLHFEDLLDSEVENMYEDHLGVGVNLATVERGASIIDEYTSSPPQGWLWMLSRNYRLDYNCMIRKPSKECWPVTGAAAIGIDLSREVNVNIIEVSMAKNYVLQRIVLYSLEGGKSAKISESFNSNVIKVPSHLRTSQIVLKVYADGKQCVNTISVFGNGLQY